MESGHGGWSPWGVPKHGVMPDLTVSPPFLSFFLQVNLQEDGDQGEEGGRGETMRERVEGAARGGGGLVGWLKMGTSLVSSILSVDSEFDRKVECVMCRMCCLHIWFSIYLVSSILSVDSEFDRMIEFIFCKNVFCVECVLYISGSLYIW